MVRILRMIGYILCLHVSVLTGQSIIYVDQTASGSADGSSWTNAYTDLQQAIAATDSGSLYIAAGNYHPQGPMADSQSVFFIDKPLKLYGGFAGTETDLSQRDLTQHTTRLNGDRMGNDIRGNFGNTRSDNSIHLVHIPAGVDGAVVLDGFHFSGAHAVNTDTTVNSYYWEGAAVYALSTVRLRNNQFEDNFALSAAGIFIGGEGANGSQLSNCQFIENQAATRGASAVVEFSRDIEIDDCQFEKNTSNFGTVLLFEVDDVAMNECHFEENIAPLSFGAGLSVYNSREIDLLKCSFLNNNCLGEGGAIYYSSDPDISGPQLTITGSEFRGNVANQFGGAIFIEQGNELSILQSRFVNNQSVNSAGGAICDYGSRKLEIKYCRIDSNLAADGAGLYFFENTECILQEDTIQANEAGNFGGGGLMAFFSDFRMAACLLLNNVASVGGGATYLGTDSNAEFMDCHWQGNRADFGGGLVNFAGPGGGESLFKNNRFVNNRAADVGGALTLGGGSQNRFIACEFSDNLAAAGGAVFVQEDRTFNRFDNCLFENNTADGDQRSGGAILGNSGSELVIFDSRFLSNRAVSGFGGAIAVSEDTTGLDTRMNVLQVERSIFELNGAGRQGGAINILLSDARIVNCLFHSNEAAGSGTGGAISNNSFFGLDNDTSSLWLINNTFVANRGRLAGGIAQFEQTDGDSSATALLILQNNIFDQGGTDPAYAEEAGTPTLISRGGNLFSDESARDLLNSLDDRWGIAEMGFVNSANGDFHLLADSPARDSGVTDGAPEVDLDGRARTGLPDIGAYEFDLVPARHLKVFTTLTIQPTPAGNFVRIELEHTYRGKMCVQIFDGLGRLCFQKNIVKNSDHSILKIETKDWLPSLYHVFMSAERQRFYGTLVKQ